MSVPRAQDVLLFLILAVNSTQFRILRSYTLCSSHPFLCALAIGTCLVLAKIRPAQWVTLHNIYSRPVFFIQGDVIVHLYSHTPIMISSNGIGIHVYVSAVAFCA